MRDSCWTLRRSAAGRSAERGMALVFALLGILLLSMLAAALLSVSNQEAFASFNYKTQNQAKYAALAGVNRTLDWFSTAYGPWLNPETGGTPGTVPITVGTFNLAVREPTFDGGGGAAPVQLGPSANFPTSLTIDGTSVVDSFNLLNTTLNTIPLGNATGSYTINSAELLFQEYFRDLFGTNNNRIIERWRIRATGTVPNALGPPTTVQETAIIQNIFVPLFNDAVRARCEIDINGALNTDSYNSTVPPGTYVAGVTNYTGGEAGATVGTNSWIDIAGGSAVINGDLYYTSPPDPACGAGVIDVPPDVVKGDIEIAPALPFPIIPSFPTGTSSDSCSGKGPTYFEETVPNPSPPPATIKLSGYQLNDNASTATPNYNSCNLGGGDGVLRLMLDPTDPDGVEKFYFHNINVGGGGAALVLWRKDPLLPRDCTNVAGDCPDVQLFLSGTFDLGGNGLVGGEPPTRFTLFDKACQNADGSCQDPCPHYVKIAGGPALYASIIAPCLACDLSGTTALYGAIMCKDVTSNGTVDVHFDLALRNKFGWTSSFRVASQSRNVF